MLPLLGLATLEANDAIGARRDQAKLQMRQLLADSAHGVEQGLAGITATAQALAISSALTSGRLAAFRQEAQDAATARQIDVVLRDPSGAQIVATRVPPGAPLPTLPAEDRQARAAIAAGRSYTSDIYASGMTHPYLARIVVPAALRTARGLETGYSVEIAFTPRTVSEWLNDTSRPTGWIVCVAGRNGQLITHSGDPDAYVGRGSALDDLGPLDGFSGAWQSYDFKGHALTGVYTRLSSGWTVSVGAPDWLLARPLREALLSFGIVAALLVCGGTLVAIFLMRRINHSVQVLHADAQELGRGNFVAHAPLPIHDLAVVHDALCSASKDIADRRVVERVLLADVRAGHDLLQAVVDGSDDLIFARGQDGQLLLANQASANLFGIKSGAEAVGLSLTQLLPPGASADTVTLASTESNRVASYGERLFELSHSALRDAGGASVGTISIAREVTQRVAADARLQRLQADLSRAGRLSAVAAMGAGLAHELHQPLSAAANFLAAAMRRLSALEASDPAAAAPVAEAMSRSLRPGSAYRRNPPAPAGLHRPGGDAGRPARPLGAPGRRSSVASLRRRAGRNDSAPTSFQPRQDRRGFRRSRFDPAGRVQPGAQRRRGARRAGRRCLGDAAGAARRHRRGQRAGQRTGH